MTSRARWMVAIAAVVMATAYVFPLWRVDLIAPQYPEGLGMYIQIDGVDGLKPNDLNSINNLNHYIGMKRIEPDAIPELKFMPWILAALIAGGLTVAALGKRSLLLVYGGTLAVVLSAGLYDYWRWGYDYGHDLDEETAIIKIPGMTYQPPLIGSKKLLNFYATSWPSGGGIALGLAAGLVAFAVVDPRKKAKAALAALALVSVAGACATSTPRAIELHVDNCEFCKMSISDARFGAQVITNTGRQLVFDSPECLAGFLAKTDAALIASRWVLDAEHAGAWVPAESAGYLIDTSLRGPMGRVTAFASPAAASAAQVKLGGHSLSWTAVSTDSAGILSTGH